MIIEYSTLPRDPTDALEVLLEALIKEIPASNNTLRAYRATQRHKADQITTRLAATLKVAQRVPDPNIRSIAMGNLEPEPDRSLSKIHSDLLSVIDALHASKIDDHFVDPEDVAAFDSAELSDADKGEIRVLMSDARGKVNVAQFLTGKQKRWILYRIGQIEDELYKPLSVFKTFLAAAADMSSLVKTVGEDAEPIAKAIQMARTVTQRKVEGYLELEKPEEQKRIEGPK